MVMEVFEGSLGSGKSASMVLDLVDHLLSGGVVAANFKLVDDWALKIADANLWVRLGLRDRYKYAQDLYERFVVVGTVESIWKASETLIPKAKGKVAQSFEGHGRLYLDECQNYFNSREWQKNKEFIHFFSQSRKLKWDCYLVSHSIGNIDKQVRSFVEYVTTFRDMRRIKIPILGLPLWPFPCFLAISRYGGTAAGSGAILKRKVYPLRKWIAGLYDSALIFVDDALAGEPMMCGPAPIDRKEAPKRKVEIKPIKPPENPELQAFFDEIKNKWCGVQDIATEQRKGGF